MSHRSLKSFRFVLGRGNGHFDLVRGEVEMWLRRRKGDGMVCFSLSPLDTFDIGFPDDLHKNARGWSGVKII